MMLDFLIDNFAFECTLTYDRKTKWARSKLLKAMSNHVDYEESAIIFATSKIIWQLHNLLSPMTEELLGSKGIFPIA